MVCLGLLALFTLQGCASAPKPNRSTEELLADAEQAFSQKKYERAISDWKLVKEKFPSPDISARVELGIADAYFLDKEYIEAAAEYEGFRKLHPRHEQADYALYRLGMSHYKQITGIDTDQTPLQNALTLFESYMVQYPGGKFRDEVKGLIADCRDKQVQYEIYVGRFYVKTGSPKSGLARLEKVLKDFPDMKRRDEVYYYLGCAYLETDQKERCREMAGKLLKEFPASVHAGDGEKLLGRCK